MSSMLEELESLLFDWEAGNLDDQGVQRVREILRVHEPARAFFVQQQMLSAALKLDVDAGLHPPAAADVVCLARTSTATIPQGSSRVWRVTLWTVTAATLLLCILAGRVLVLEYLGGQPAMIAVSHAGPRDARTEAMSSGVALVTELVDVVWEANQTPLAVGDALLPGRMAIQAGFAQVEFFCGATLIIEGPAELDLKSTTLARVHSGRLRAQVPPAARGFSLEVDDLQVVDLGTEFGLSVSPAGADIQVFDGEVEVHAPQADSQLLTTGQAVVRNVDGEFQSAQITPERFVDINALETRANSQRMARYEKWQAWSAAARRDPRLIAYYSFDQPGGWERKLPSSLDPSNTELDGAIVGAGRVQGRWPSKVGLEFKRPGDRVRVHIPGEFSSLTFACWAKIDSLDRWYNSLFLTDGYNQGEPHWQILDSGQLFFSVRAKRDRLAGESEVKGPTHQEVLSPSFWKPAMSGRWLHLATTYDVERAVTKHYLNGQLLHSEAIAQEMLVNTTRIGAATIGNWSSPTQAVAEFAIRNINGSIDEFAIYGAALAATEIQEMFEHGQP